MLDFWCYAIASFLLPGCFCSEFRFIQKEGEISFQNFKTSSATKEQVFIKNGTILSKETTSSVQQCWLRCVESKDCLSVNIISLDQSRYQCELLNWAGSGFGKHLLAKANATFIQAYTICDLTKPCKNGGECVAQDGGKNYTCECRGERNGFYTGRNCEKRADCVLFDFESGNLTAAGWTLTGTAFKYQPTYDEDKYYTPLLYGLPLPNKKGDWLISTYFKRPSPSDPAKEIQGDQPTGTATSPSFVIHGKKLKLLLGGNTDQNNVRVELLIGGAVAKVVSSSNGTAMTPKEIDLTAFRMQTAQLRIVDAYSGIYGHIMVDHIEEICSE